MKAMDFDRYLKKQLQRPGFRQAYEDLEEEYELAKQVIRFRLSRNLSQAQLARLVGTSQPAIARLESGNHRNMTLGFLSRVARALNLRAEMTFRPLPSSRRPRASGARRAASRATPKRAAR